MKHACRFSAWLESIYELPPLGEVIEGINPKDWMYSELGRDYFALVKINKQLIWITPNLTDLTFKEIKITHWRHIPPNPEGENPFVKIKKEEGKAGWMPKVFFKKKVE